MSSPRTLVARVISGIAVLAVAATGLIGASSPAQAADLGRFKPGAIISDALFYNSGTMSEAQVQGFLESKMTQCSPGYTCLRDYYDTSRATSADAMCAAYPGGYRERASAIIAKVAVACGINPQVLIVMLQKEQGLVRDSAPGAYSYRSAMGQGCPDTAACDSRYYGFFNQVYGAAWQLKRYANPPGTSQFFTWYPVGRTTNVLYNPNGGCGSSPVYIENKATSALYYYTPYQPNQAALNAGYGLGDGCSAYGNRNFFNYMSDWFGMISDPNAPIGNVEGIVAVPGGFQVRGWALDPNSSSPIDVHVYSGAIGAPVTADVERADVGAAYPGLGSRHGFSVFVPASGEGFNSVCVYGINVGAGANAQLACARVQAMSGSPFGLLEGVEVVPGGVRAGGWAIDPDTTAPMVVHMYVDAASVAVSAGNPRTDVGAAYPAYGPAHGFTRVMAAAPGTRTVCAYGINTGNGANVQLGCAVVTVPPVTDAGRPPIGNVESISVDGNTVRASGWALDPDTALPVQVRLEVAGLSASSTADRTRADVGAAYPALGAEHGFGVSMAVPTGRVDVCVVAVNTGAGGDTALGCTAVDASLPDLGRAPIGNLEAVQVGADTAVVSGWALDPDATDPISVHVYVRDRGQAASASLQRPDIAAAFPQLLGGHGFSVVVPVLPGASRVCVYGINTGRGANALIGCQNIQAADRTRPPTGNFEVATTTAGAVSVAGWALDRDTPDPIAVHVYVDGVGTAFLADQSRADVAAAFPGSGDRHGFTATVPATAGQRTVCLYAINDVVGPNTALGCRAVTVP